MIHPIEPPVPRIAAAPHVQLIVWAAVAVTLPRDGAVGVSPVRAHPEVMRATRTSAREPADFITNPLKQS